MSSGEVNSTQRVVAENEQTPEGHMHVVPPPAKKKDVGHWVIIAVILVVVLVGAVIYSGIHARAASESALTQRTEENAVPTVSVVKPKPTSSSQEILLPGNTQAFNDTPIYARTNGYLRRWYVDIGARVKKGQLLADIETPEIDQQLLQARADLKSAQAEEELAQTTAARWQNLLKTNSVSRQETDQAVSNLHARQASVESSLANVRRLEQLQSFERIYAPFDGVITARNTDIGALISAGANGAPKELFHLAALETVRVYVAVPEIYASAAQDGATATLTLDEYPGKVFDGKIVRNANAIDPVSRTLNVEVDVKNQEGELRPGAYAFVHLKIPEKMKGAATQSLTIPSNTLLFRSEGLRVGVVHGDKVDLVPIHVGRDFGDKVEVLSGLQPSDSIVVNPSDSLLSGAPVHVASTQGGMQ